jgi:branched-chain amino acid transport system permease protein
MSTGEVIIQVIINGIFIGAVYGLVAMGLSLIFGVMNVINFVHGDFLMVSMYLGYVLVKGFGGDPFFYLIPVVAVMLLLGIAVYRGVFDRLIHAPHTSQLLAGYALALILQNGALMIFSSNYRSLTTSYSSSAIRLAQISISIPRLIAFIACGLTAFALVWIINRTRLGKMIRATAINPDGAEITGINTKRVFALAFGIGIASVGIAGISLLPILYVYPTLGDTFTLFSFIVAVLGSLGNIWGTFKAGIIIGIVSSITSTWIAGDLPMLVVFVMFILTLMFRPSGLFAKKAA